MEQILIVLMVLLLIITLALKIQIIRIARDLDYSFSQISKDIFRGMLKHIAYSTLEQNIHKKAKIFIVSLILFLISTVVFVSFKVWGTDYSFIIILYPLFISYYFSKYLMWEHIDILEKQSKTEDDKGFIKKMILKIKNKNIKKNE